jgi:hypothetical protein
MNFEIIFHVSISLFHVAVMQDIYLRTVTFLLIFLSRFPALDLQLPFHIVGPLTGDYQCAHVRWSTVSRRIRVSWPDHAFLVLATEKVALSDITLMYLVLLSFGDFYCTVMNFLCFVSVCPRLSTIPGPFPTVGYRFHLIGIISVNLILCQLTPQLK